MKKFTAAIYLFTTFFALGPIPDKVLGQNEILVPLEEFTFLTEQLKELEKDIEIRTSRVADLQSTIATLEAEIQEKNRQIDDIQVTSGNIQALKAENSELEAQNAQFSADHDNLEKQRLVLQEKITSLENQIAHMQATWIPKPRPNPRPRTEPEPEPRPTTTTVDPPTASTVPPPPPVIPSPPSFQHLTTSVEGYQFNRSGQKLPDGRTRIFQVNVTISDPISQREYRKFCRQSSAVRCPSGISDSSAPVTGISWNDANAYMRWLSRHTRQPYRFPWYQEIAARPALGNEWSSQYGSSAQVVNTSGQMADATLAPLGQRRAGAGFRLAIE